MTRGLVLGVVLFFCNTALGLEFDAKVIAVMDGDTVLLLHQGKKIKARLINIDAPELAQPYGKESRLALLNSVHKKQVHVTSHAVDKYGRMIVDLRVDGKSVNEEQVRNGMAWEYSHFHKNKRFRLLHQQARQARRGLWALPAKPIAPERWRKTHPNKFKFYKFKTASQHNSNCGKKHLCSQMNSCEEATFYFTRCGEKSLDGNADGQPCENLCLAEKIK